MASISVFPGDACAPTHLPLAHYGSSEMRFTRQIRPLQPEMPFTEAASVFLDNAAAIQTKHRVAQFLRASTLGSYQQYAKSLCLFFGDTALEAITPNMIRKYQELRLNGEECFMRPRRPGAPVMACPAGPKKVNQELALLKRIMTRAGCWRDIVAEYYAPLLEEQDDDIERALTPQEQGMWLSVAASRPQWQLVYWYSLLAFGTTMSSSELRMLRLGDVSLQHRTITVSRAAAKCNGRQRVISLVTAEELWAAECLLERARRCGASSPLHYVFPLRERGPHAGWNPEKPMSNSGIKKPWEEVREASGLKRFRIYDTRHTGGTRLAEAGVNISVIKARMGHLTQHMHEHYCRIAEPIQRQQIQDAFAWQKGRIGRVNDTAYPPFPGGHSYPRMGETTWLP